MASFKFTAERPVAITMVVLAVLVFGLVGLLRLPVNLLPDVSYPKLTVRTTYPGAGPQDVEERISRRVQEAVSVVPGVRRVVSVSRPEVSDVVLEFTWGTEMVFAVSEVRERLDRVFLPQDAERPLVLRYDPSLDPVMTLGLYPSDGAADGIDLMEVRRLADEELVEKLQLDGVAAVKVRGGDEEEIRIEVDEGRLTALGMDIGTVGDRIRSENVNAAAGSIDEGETEYLVRALGEYRTLDELRRTIVDRRGDANVRLDDLAPAGVQRVAADKDVITRIDGRLCVLVDIQKEAAANIVDLCSRMRDRVLGTDAQRRDVAAGKHLEPLPEFDKENPRKRSMALTARQRTTDFLAFELQREGIEVEVLQDQSVFIAASVDDVLNSALFGGLIAIFVIYLFLRNFKSTAILAVSIPISLMATFAPMFGADIDLNIMSLGGLALGVGMLVDNSIVVLESIARRREDGLGPREAAVDGVGRVAGAVVASTLTTVAVFFPIVFVEGVAGQLFRDQALTVVFALLCSLLVALFVIPMLASRGGTDPHHKPAILDQAWVAGDTPSHPNRFVRILSWPFWAIGALCRGVVWLGTHVVSRKLMLFGAIAWLLGKIAWVLLWIPSKVFEAVYGLVDRIYRPLLKGSLRARPAVLLIAAGLLAAAVLRLPSLGREVLPAVHQGEFWVDTFLPRDTRVERTDEINRRMEAAIGALPDVTSTFLASGIDKEELNDSDQGEHSARILVRLASDRDRRTQELRVQEEIREILEREPEFLNHRFSQSSALTFNAPFVVEVIGHDLRHLREASEQVVDLLEGFDDLDDVRATLQRGSPEVSVRFDRDRLAAVSLDPADATRILRSKVLGDVPTRFAERERRIDMRVRLDRSDLASVQEFMDLNVNPAGFPAIPLRSVAEVKSIEGPSEIRRLGTVRGAEIQASVKGLDLGGTQDAVQAELSEMEFPRGVTARMGGQKEDLEESSQSLTMALLLAVFLVYVVMASQFESLVQPLVILFSLPLALVGAVFALDLLDIPLSVIVFLGAIVLAGIVVNNAIILVDQINRLRGEGMPKMDAIIEGAHTRLRPVLMTTMTTVLGLVPLTGWLVQPGNWVAALINGSPVFGSEGLELRAPMAVTVIAGLTASTLLTLLVIPVVYSMSDRRA